MEQAPLTKTCIHCKETKELELFAKGKKNKFGRRGSCKKCDAKQAKENRVKNFKKRAEKYKDLPLTRVCKKCNTEKKLDDFKKNKYCLYGKTHTCKNCHNKQTSENNQIPYFRIKRIEEKKRHYLKHKEKINQKVRILNKIKYYENHEESKEKKCKAYHRLKDKETFKNRVINYRKSISNLLLPTYVKSVLCKKLKLSFNDVTNEQVQLQRESIQLHREYKQLKQQLQ
jgi:hypothetical protein